MVYYARSKNDSGQMETVAHHLSRAGELCAQFLSALNYEDWGKILGNIHDGGKISPTFQQVLMRQKTGVNHALPGAVMALSMYGSQPSTAKLMAAVIASHHGELKSYHAYESEIKSSLAGAGQNLDCENREYSLFGQTAYRTALAEWRKDFLPQKRLSSSPSFQSEEDSFLSKMLFERFLFSALVDADWSSSAEHFQPDYFLTHTGPPLDPEKAMEQLLVLRKEKQNASHASSSLNCLRDQLFDACLAAGNQEPGLFTLTAPTGLGKTLSLFAFAAQHCIRWKKRRIILILPYLTIIEQNCKDYKQIISDLLEIHSNVQWSEDHRLLAERWDAPCIVTTNVSFFEPLFSARAGSCRHLHQFANSVIVLDEAQSLPSHLLDATLRTVKLLCDHYGCTVVFSTATQPSFQHRPGLDWKPREITPNPAVLFDKTRRVTWHWRINQPISLYNLSEELSDYPQICVIVNLKRHARTLLEQLLSLRPKEEVFYLSTDLCPAHRSDVLADVTERLKNGQPCCLVATQCIEAGVDLDFPVLYRALAPLEALIQAAGRCNRNGDSPAGQMTVFVPDEERLYPTGEYERAAFCVRDLFSRHEIDCNDLSHIDEYYQLLYEGGDKDKKALRDAIQQEDYIKTEQQYQMIEQAGVQVIVPYIGKSELFKDIRSRLDRDGLTSEIIRDAKELTVSCYDEEKVKQNCESLYHLSYEVKKDIPTNYYLLGIDSYYDEKQGLYFENMFDGIM